MDSEVLRPLINYSLMPKFQGRKVTLLGTVEGSHPDGKTFKLKSSDADGKSISVILREPKNEPIMGLVEVHGIVQSNTTVMCDNIVIHGQAPFEMGTYNKIVQLTNFLPDFWAVRSN